MRPRADTPPKPGPRACAGEPGAHRATARPHAAAALALAAADSTSAVDIAALREAIPPRVRGKTSAAGDVAAGRSAIRWRANLSNGRSCAATRREHRFLPLHRLHRCQSELAEPAMLRRRAEAALWQTAAIPLPCAPSSPKSTPPPEGAASRSPARCCAGRPRRRTKAGARGLAQRQFSNELESPALDMFGDLITPADHKARMDMRLYAEDVEGAMRSATALGGNALCHRQGAHRRHQEGAERQGAARRGAGRGPRDIGYIFSRVQLLRRADKIAEAAELMLVATARSRDRRSIPTSGGSSGGSSRASCSTSATHKTAYRVARDAAPPSKENYRVEQQFTAGWIALRFLNDPAARRSPISRSMAQGDSNPITLARAGYWQGRALEALGRTAKRARITRRRRSTRPPITARSRAPGSATRTSRCVRRRSRARRAASTGSRSCAPTELLYAIDERDLVAGAAGRSRRTVERCRRARRARRGRRPPQGRPRHAAARQGRARRAACRSSTMPFRPSVFPTIAPIGPAVEPERGLCDRPPGKHLQPEDRFQRARHGPDAGDARSRTIRRQEVRRALRREAAAERSGLQRAAGRGRARRPDRRLPRLLHPDLRRLQCRPRPGEGMDRNDTAIRAIPRSIRSTGWSASRSPRRATTSSACWKICRSIACASAAAPSS